MVYYINLRARFVTGTNSSTNSTILFTGDKFGGNIYLKMEGIRFYHNDHLGTPQVLTDESGQIAWYGDYEPFGKVNILVERTTNNFRFPGQYFIEETGLYYNWWRWYESEVGRYMEFEPKEITILLRYDFEFKEDFLYSRNNPVVYYDLNGMKSTLILPAGGSYIINCYKCARPIFRWGRILFPSAPDDRNNHMRHCWTSCEVASECGRLCAFTLGWLNEIVGVYDPEDVEANSKGRNCSLSNNCYYCCKGCE